MFERLSIRKKVSLLFLLPFTVTTIFAFLLANFIILKPLLDVRQAESLFQLQESVLELVHGLQAEKGMTVGFLTYAGQNFGEHLNEQRIKVDQSAKKLPQDLQNRLLPLQEVRSMADKLEITPQDAFNIYSNMIESLLIAIKQEAKKVDNSRLFRRFQSSVLLAYIEENADKERAIITSIFAKDVLEPSDRDIWYRALTNQESYVRVLSDLAPAEVVELYAQKVSEDKVEKFRQFLREKTEFFGVNASEWFSVASERMEKMEEVMKFLLELTAKEIEEMKKTAIRNALLFAGLGAPPFFLSLFIALLLIRNVSGSVKELEEVIREVVKEANFSKRAEVKSKDELGKIAENFNSLLSSLDSVIGEMRGVMASAASGDFSKRITSELRGDLLVLKEKVNKVMEVIEFLVDSLISVANASVEISRAMEMVEEGTRKQSESTRRIASAVEQIGSALEETANSTELASNSATETSRTVEDSSKLMESFRSTMTKVREGGEKIRHVASAIQDVAEQVNLLALNAAIEAARAGEQGRGFAVVADEVRRLAEQVGKMAGSVSQTVQDVVSTIEEGYRSTDVVHKDFEKIREAVERIREMLHRIAVSMEETSTGIREISTNMENLEEVGNNNAVASEEVLSRMVELARKVEETRRKVEELKG